MGLNEYKQKLNLLLIFIQLFYRLRHNLIRLQPKFNETWNTNIVTTHNLKWQQNIVVKY